MGGGVIEAAGVLAERQPASLQRAVHLAEGNAGMLEEGEFEGRVVGDDIDAVEQLQDAGPGVVEIDDEDLVAAVVDLQEANTGAARVQPGLLGELESRRRHGLANPRAPRCRPPAPSTASSP